MGASTPMPTPQPPRRRRSQQGVDSRTAEQPPGPLLRSTLSRWRKRLALRRLGRAQRRPVWLFGCSRLSTPCGCACGGAVAGWHGRQCAHASSSDSPWLSERRCAAAKRVPRRTPQPPRRRFAPSHREGVADLGSPSFAFFSWRGKKRRCAAGRTSRHPPWAKACCQINEQAQASTSSARTGGGTARRSY